MWLKNYTAFPQIASKFAKFDLLKNKSETESQSFFDISN